MIDCNNWMNEWMIGENSTVEAINSDGNSIIVFFVNGGDSYSYSHFRCKCSQGQGLFCAPLQILLASHLVCQSSRWRFLSLSLDFFFFFTWWFIHFMEFSFDEICHVDLGFALVSLWNLLQIGYNLYEA